MYCISSLVLHFYSKWIFAPDKIYRLLTKCLQLPLKNVEAFHGI